MRKGARRGCLSPVCPPASAGRKRFPQPHFAGPGPEPVAGVGAEEPSAVVGQCRRIQHELLPGEAPRLAEHLLRLELEPQVWWG